MTITLITGANKGLGFEAARRLIQQGHTIYLGARNTEAGRSAEASLGGRFVQLDVTDDASVNRAMEKISSEEGRLDVLINNAAIVGTRQPPTEVTPETMREVYETNVFGAMRMIQASLGLLSGSDNPRIVNVASALGSMWAVTNPERIESTLPSMSYGSSKSALIAMTVFLSKALPGFRINAVDPGYTATDINQHRGTQTVEEGTDAIVTYANIDSDGPTGGLFDRNGVLPW